MPIRRNEPVFDRLTKKDREILKIQQPAPPKDVVKALRDQARSLGKGKEKNTSPAEWE